METQLTSSNVTITYSYEASFQNEKLLLKVLNGKDAKNVSFILNIILICGTVAFFGIIGNGINIFIFTKQGFDNTMNISLLGIAVSDLCTLVTVLWLGICVNPFLQTDDVAFLEIEYLTAGWPHYLFARITCMITVYITIERCLCVIIPLKVKNVITKTKTIVIVVSIFTTQSLTAFPTYYSAYIGWKFVPIMNRSVLGLCRTENWDEYNLATSVLQEIMQGGSFILLIFFTALLIISVRKQAKWRATSSSEKHQGSLTGRDKKMVKMVVLIALILIVCFTPGMLGFVGMILEPEYNMGGKYDGLFWMTWSMIFIFQTTNSSVNIFVYYKMSSRYRDVFNEKFPMFGQQTIP